MKSQSLKPAKGTLESSDKKLSRLIEKLNAELKVMNEINPALAEEIHDPSVINIPESKKRKSTLKPKQS